MFINSLKMIFAAIFSILFAQLLNLDFAISAGIVAILTIQPSKRETFSTALARLYGFITAIILCFICFKILGINIKGYFLYLVIYIIICQKFRWYSSIAMNSVLVSHFISLGLMDKDAIINEALIFLIGLFFGILVNLHLHQNKKEINRLKTSINQQIKKIIHRMSLRILDNNLADYDGSCFLQLNKELEEAKNLALINYKNQLKKDDSDIKYFDLLTEKIGILYQMFKRVKNIKTQAHTAKIISDFLERFSQNFESKSEREKLLSEFTEIWQGMKEKALPQNRQEFEDRAELYTLLELIEEELKIF